MTVTPNTSAAVPQARHASPGARRSTLALVLATVALATGLLAFWLTEGFFHWGLPRLHGVEQAAGSPLATFLFSLVSVPSSVAALLVARSARSVLALESSTSITGGRARLAQVVALVSLLPALFAPGAAALLFTLLWLGH